MFKELSVPRDPVSTAISTGLHILIAGVIILLALHHFVPNNPSPKDKQITYLAPDLTPIPLSKSNGAKSGGGSNEPTPASNGSPPPQSNQQLIPPTTHIPPDAKLTVPQTQLQNMPSVLPNIGDPHSNILLASNGSGFPTGVGAGKDGGIGDKNGPGGVNGTCNPGQNCYGPEGVDTTPAVLSKTDPEFTEEARKNKQQGIVLVCMWITASGTATHIQPVQRLGFGLDESVIKSVATWKFKPATKNGRPVTVSDVCVNVNFQMF